MSASTAYRRLSKPLAFALLLLAAACASSPRHTSTPSPHYKIGNPYQVGGRWYYPKHDPDYEKVGVASWYGRDFHGRPTANGEIFDMNRMSAAHKTLPLPSIVEVTNLENGRKIKVRVNDRGPFARGRVIDMSRAAARRLGFEQNGLARVRVRYVAPAVLAARAPRPGVQPIAVAAAPPIGAPGDAATDAETASVMTAMADSPAPTPTLKPAPAPTGEIVGEAPGPNTPVLKPAPSNAGEIVLADNNPAEPALIEASVAPISEIAEQPIIDLSKAPESALKALYVIRVATLSRLDNIETLKNALADAGPLRVSRIENDAGAVFYRVSMGPYSTIEIAAAPLEAVRAAGYADATIVTLLP